MADFDVLDKATNQKRRSDMRDLPLPLPHLRARGVDSAKKAQLAPCLTVSISPAADTLASASKGGEEGGERGGQVSKGTHFVAVHRADQITRIAHCLSTHGRPTLWSPGEPQWQEKDARDRFAGREGGNGSAWLATWREAAGGSSAEGASLPCLHRHPGMHICSRRLTLLRSRRCRPSFFPLRLRIR